MHFLRDQPLPSSDIIVRRLDHLAELVKQMSPVEPPWSAPGVTMLQSWQLIYLGWNARRIAAHLARSHTPEVCFTAVGHELETLPGMRTMPWLGLRLPFRVHSFRTAQGPVFLFYCRGRTARGGTDFDTEVLTYANRFAAVREARRNLGQRPFGGGGLGFVGRGPSQSSLAGRTRTPDSATARSQALPVPLRLPHKNPSAASVSPQY